MIANSVNIVVAVSLKRSLSQNKQIARNVAPMKIGIAEMIVRRTVGIESATVRKISGKKISESAQIKAPSATRCLKILGSLKGRN